MPSSRRLPISYNEHTYDSAGGRDYTSLVTWESDHDVNCVTNAKGEVLTCYSGIHNDSVAISGATTNTSYFRVIRAATGQRGTPTSGVRFENLNVTAHSPGIYLAEDFSSAYDLASRATSTLGDGIHCCGFMCHQTTGNRIVGCTAYNINSSGTNGYGFGFYMNWSAGKISYIVNCVAVSVTGTSNVSCGFFANVSEVGTSTANLYNCTAVSCKNGLYAYTIAGGNVIVVNAKNCIFQSNTTNVNSSGLGTEIINPITNVTSGVTFDTDGYHLKQGVIGSAVAQGTNLSADPNFAFDDDIDGETITRAWAVGCDWYAPITSSVPSGSSRKLPTYYYESTYGAGQNYTLLATWAADTDINLITPTVGFVLTCVAGIYNDTAALYGATTNANYFRVIRAAAGQRGTPTSGVRFVKVVTTDTQLFIIGEAYDSVQDIAIKLTSTNGSIAYSFFTYSNNVSFIGCTAYDVYTTGTAIGFRVSSLNPGYIINCLAYNVDGGVNSSGMMVGDNSGTNQNIYIYNSTVVGCNVYGILMTSQAGYTTTTYLKNSIIQNNGTNLYAIGAGTETWVTTTNVTSGVTFAADGYHLAPTDTVAINHGTDLS
ncbi:MAG: hypothetical protein WA087_02090, partial [Candidatus Saccharimonadales bacterium]